jgi:hypothetical protein
MMSAILMRARARFGRPPAVAGAEPPEEISQHLTGEATQSDRAEAPFAP